MGVGGHVLGIRQRGAVRVHTDGGTVCLVIFGLVRLRIARVAFPEIGSLEELEARAGKVHRLERVDEAEDLGTRIAEELAHFLDEGQNRRTHHDVIDHIGVARDLREIFGKGRFCRRDRDLCDNLAALRLDRCREVIAVIMSEGEVRIDHRDLLAERAVHERCHRLDLALHIGDAGLQRVAVQHAAGDMMALGNNEIGDFQLAGARGGPDDDVAEQCAKRDVTPMLGGHLFHDLGTALGIRSVILGDDLDRTAVDSAFVIDLLHCGLGGAVVPAAVGGADSGPVDLEADLDWLRALHLAIAPEQRHAARRRRKSGGGCQCLDRLAAAWPRCVDPVVTLIHGLGVVHRRVVDCFLHESLPLKRDSSRIASGLFLFAFPFEFVCVQTACPVQNGKFGVIRPLAPPATTGRARCRAP